MKNITFYARLVKYIAYTLIPIVIIGFVTKWFSPEFALTNPHIFGLFFSYTFNDYAIISSSVPTMPLTHRLLGMLFDSVVLGLFIAILWSIAAIMNTFKNNEFFSSRTVSAFSSISTYAFYLALYTPFNRMILSLVTTLHVRPHTLSVSFGSVDLFNIFIFGSFMVMTLLLQQATQLQNEQNLTV